jgi:hypothetical protein
MDWTKRWVAGHLLHSATICVGQSLRFLAFASTAHKQGLTPKELMYLEKRRATLVEVNVNLSHLVHRIQTSCGQHGRNASE